MKSRKTEIAFPIQDESPAPNFICIECHKPCSEAPYWFSGGFACESCVRTYYRNQSPADIADELRCRGSQASRIVGKKRKGNFND